MTVAIAADGEQVIVPCPSTDTIHIIANPFIGTCEEPLTLLKSTIGINMTRGSFRS